jgi:hypothetical protein
MGVLGTLRSGFESTKSASWGAGGCRASVEDSQMFVLSYAIWLFNIAMENTPIFNR